MKTLFQLLLVILVGCVSSEGGGGRAGQPDDGDDGASAGGTGGAPSSTASNAQSNGTSSSSGGGALTTSAASSSTGGNACLSEIPCASDLQCTTLPGFACNEALPSPLCQQLACGEDVPCDGRDEFCTAGRLCRMVDHADGLRCLPEALAPGDCLESCMTAPVDATQCNVSTALCADFCTMTPPNTVCEDHDGLRHVESLDCYYDAFAGRTYPAVHVRCLDGLADILVDRDQPFATSAGQAAPRN